ncbi:MAG: thiamine pyrophosphate-dependent enzyme [Armatimonadota bacterium]
MATIKQLVQREDRLTGGHRLCGGCGAPIAARHILLATENPLVMSCATGCLEVATTIYPYTAWKIPWIHSAFENSAATIAGVEAAYQALKRSGKVTQDIKFVAFGGDGGTYDIGIQALSGALERGHDMLYVCYNNEAYMNTGVQRSGATPIHGATTTSPVGSVVPGKPQNRKNLTEIVAAHDAPYVAQASSGNFRDLNKKAEKAFAIEGACFINVLSPCPLGWISDASKTVEICKLAADTCFWPLYEVEHGQYKLTYKPREKKPVEEYISTQGRFRHIMRDESKKLLRDIQEEVDREWERLLKKCGEA